MRGADQKQHNRSDAAQTNQPLIQAVPLQLLHQFESRSLDQQKLWHKLDQQRSEIRQANEAVSYRSKSEMAASSSSSVNRAKTSGLLPPSGADNTHAHKLVIELNPAAKMPLRIFWRALRKWFSLVLAILKQ
jgi:hypothetical protein